MFQPPCSLLKSCDSGHIQINLAIETGIERKQFTTLLMGLDSRVDLGLRIRDIDSDGNLHRFKCRLIKYIGGKYLVKHKIKYHSIPDT
jgi:hypothetical protein